MKKKHFGYSVIEMVAVLATIGVTMAIATPSLIRANQNYQLNSSATEVAQSLQNAKFEAIRRNTLNSVGFDKGSNSILLTTTTNDATSGASVVKTAVVPLPSTVSITSLPSTISAPTIVQSAYNNRSSFTDTDYKNLADVKSPTSFAVDTSVTGGNRFKASFTSKGLPATAAGGMADPGIVHWVYLKGINNEWLAVTLTSAGSTQIWRYKNSAWIAITN